MLNCRRCGSQMLIELGRLNGSDHPVYRCRLCGFLFSPPEQDLPAGRDADVQRSPADPEPRRPVSAGPYITAGRGNTTSMGKATTDGSASMR